ncbi:MAG: hypothetical protein HYZ49_09080 [Chloroflexi bacterium]|nr:hypothetical protein [Chloroflexota bacterium]
MGHRGSVIVNLFTVLILAGTVVMGLYFFVILLSPSIFLNPFPPSTLPAIAVLPSVTPAPPTSIVPTFPPLFTPTPTFTSTQPRPSATFTPGSEATTPAPDITASDVTEVTAAPGNTETFTPTPTPTDTPSGPTPTPSRTRSAFPFTAQENAPIPVQNFANSAGCNWMGIAGQALGLPPGGNPIVGLIVHLEGGGLNADAFTGSKTAYGPAGYEFFLNNHVVQTTGEYKVQLLDTSGTPLSDFVIVNTFADCSKNLLLVNFVQNH